MATEAPDPRTFNSWDDAFQYPVPVVQKLEHQLRNHAAENRDKLRSLVGASYRDLLETAETIIDMSTQMQRVESSLAHITHNTNSRALDRIARTTARSHAEARARDAERLAFASQMATLRACSVVIARLLRSKGGSLLLAAKVLVVGRLLHKALTARGKEGDGLTEKMREKLGGLRARLLRRVDRRLARGEEGRHEENVGGEGEGEGGDEGEKEVEGLVEAMCAYALATSSTPSDVLRHFHHVRMERILGTFQREESEGDGVRGVRMKEKGVEALKLCLKTTHDTQAIFPRRLADALVRLKTQPLVQDPDVRSLYELNLDIHERWLGDEARNYTPQPRHDELKRPEADRLLAAWGKQAVSAFLKEMKEGLADTKDLKEVAELRQELVELWLVRGSRMAGVKSRTVLDHLRDAMNWQLSSIVRSRSQQLTSVVELVTSILSIWPDNQKPLSLWDATAAASELSNGAQAFRTRILNLHRGRDESVLAVTAKFDAWMASVLEVESIVKHMKETRWDDPFSDDIDLEDEEDEGGESVKQTLLSSDDPRLLEETTQGALAEALAALSESFARIAKEITGTDGADAVEGEHRRVSKSIFLLRLTREITTRTARLTPKPGPSSSPSPAPFTTSSLEPLHSTLATHVMTPVLATYRGSLTHHHQSRIHSLTTLWEGTPPLPAQPSPSAFRLLRDLTRDMAKLGADLWGPEAVSVLKRVAGVEMGKVWEGYVNCIGKEKETPPETPEPPVKDESDSGKGGEEGKDACVDREKEKMSDKASGKQEEKADKEVNEEKEDDSDEREGEKDGEKAMPTLTPESSAGSASSEHAATPRASAETTNTDSTSDSTKQQVADALKQLVFDVWYVRFFLSEGGKGVGEGNAEGGVYEVPYEAAGLEDEEMRARVRKSVWEYVRRTWLLFAVLRG